MCRHGFNMEKKRKTQNETPKSLSLSALETGLFTVATNSYLQVTMTTGSAPVSSESQKTDIVQGQTLHLLFCTNKSWTNQPEFEALSVLKWGPHISGATMISCSWAFYLNPLEPPATEDVAGAGLGGQEIFPLSLSILVASGDCRYRPQHVQSQNRNHILFSRICWAYLWVWYISFCFSYASALFSSLVWSLWHVSRVLRL